MVLGARFMFKFHVLSPCYIAIQGSTSLVYFWTRRGLLYTLIFLCLKQASPHLSSLHTALLSGSRRVCDKEWAPSARHPDSFEERQPGNVKHGDGGLFRSGWWVETSWRVKWQHRKESGIFLRHRQEFSQLLIWSVHLAFNPVISLEGGSVHTGLSFSEFKGI